MSEIPGARAEEPSEEAERHRPSENQQSRKKSTTHAPIYHGRPLPQQAEVPLATEQRMLRHTEPGAQQRHLLAHCEGIVDQRYIDRSGDRTYAVGQRVVVKADAVRLLAALVRRLGEGLAALVPPTT